MWLWLSIWRTFPASHLKGPSSESRRQTLSWKFIFRSIPYSNNMSPEEVQMFDRAMRQFRRMTLQITVVRTGCNKFKKIYHEPNGDKTIKWTIVHWLSIDIDCLQFKTFRKSFQRSNDQLLIVLSTYHNWCKDDETHKCYQSSKIILQKLSCMIFFFNWLMTDSVILVFLLMMQLISVILIFSS